MHGKWVFNKNVNTGIFLVQNSFLPGSGSISFLPWSGSVSKLSLDLDPGIFQILDRFRIKRIRVRNTARCITRTKEVENSATCFRIKTWNVKSSTGTILFLPAPTRVTIELDHRNRGHHASFHARGVAARHSRFHVCAILHAIVGLISGPGLYLVSRHCAQNINLGRKRNSCKQC